jgi:hypothetical protein
MNTSQARHAKAMARKIKTHAESIARNMTAIESQGNYADIPIETVNALFTVELTGHIRNIEQVVEDMLPELDRQ